MSSHNSGSAPSIPEPRQDRKEPARVLESESGAFTLTVQPDTKIEIRAGKLVLVPNKPERAPK